MALEIGQQQDGDQLIVSLKGHIDEDATFIPLQPAVTKAVLDLDAVTAINSVGIREWIKWTKSFPAGVEVTVRKLPKVIVDQANMVAGFLPSGTIVESFYVPYYCDGSGEEKMVLFTNGKEFGGGQVNAPENVTDSAGDAMEMDIIETKYFKFITNG